MSDETSPDAPEESLVEALSEYVDADGSESSSDYVTACAGEASTLVANYVGSATLPPSILRRAVLEVGADLYHRRASRNGVVGFEGGDILPVRIARDPMLSAYPLLRQYLPIGLA